MFIGWMLKVKIGDVIKQKHLKALLDKVYTELFVMHNGVQLQSITVIIACMHLNLQTKLQHLYKQNSDFILIATSQSTISQN